MVDGAAPTESRLEGTPRAHVSHSTRSELTEGVAVSSPALSTASRRSRTSNCASPRVSPYPQRDRTPPQRLQDEASPATNAASPSAHRTAAQHRLQLVIQPIVKNTIGQRDTSGEALDVFAVNGATFNDIIRKIWTKFSCRVKGQAVKRDGTWSVEEPLEQSWSKVMQFENGRHLVDSTKNSQAWNRWIASARGETVKLMIYQYGLAIAKAQDLEKFLTACIRPVQTDRSGAAAESSLQEVVEELKKKFGVQHFRLTQLCGECGRKTLFDLWIDRHEIVRY
ncbi:hypothetical protein GN958_ATG11212 [Phytophthora infestans]|uniref:Uncharacterized protein n=1 Tax=Phytophthora infestans TaxID=4787 RepID=A0A8S9UJS1_PHYIN|nr:hypothetical protein GN958_ATG11212 [Phytophthora infestans]